MDIVDLVPRSAKSSVETSSLRTPLHDEETSQSGTTATAKPPSIELDDIFLSVKTTKGNHDSRLDVILKTWFQKAKEQVSWQQSDTNWIPGSIWGLSFGIVLCTDVRKNMSSGEVICTKWNDFILKKNKKETRKEKKKTKDIQQQNLGHWMLLFSGRYKSRHVILTFRFQ